MPSSVNLLDTTLTEWIYQSIYSKLDNPSQLNKSKISMHKCFNPITAKSQIIAYANADKFDGAFVILEDMGDKYQEIFAVKVKLIMSVQIRHPNIILACMEESGIGTATVNFRLIKETKKGYKEVWHGLANFYNYNYDPQHCFEVVGGINFSNTGELIHSILKRIYKEGSEANPVNIEKLFDIYMYDEGNMKYQFVKRL